MRFFKAILIGLTQGLTEFLPVSSSGHLLLLEKLSVAPPSVFFNLILHLATLAAVLVVMRKEVWEMICHPLSSDLKYVALASLPTAAIALLISRFFPSLLLGEMLGFGFLLTAAILFLGERFAPSDRLLKIGAKNAFLTGIAQGIAVLPGVSRSGATISFLRLSGVEREKAVGFSFLLSIPVIAGGFLLEGIESGFRVDGAGLSEILLAAFAAFLSGVFALRFMLRKIKKGAKPFCFYTFALGIACFFIF